MNKTKRFFSNSWSMYGRCTRLAFRNIDGVLMSIMMPAMMMLMFVYLFGGAMNVGNFTYVNYVVAGVLILCIGQCASLTATSLNQDMKSGMLDRFLSMPVARSSFLVGHLLSAVLRNLIATAIVIIIAIAIGFRPTAGFSEWILIILILVAFMFLMTWLSIFFGLLAKSPEGAGAFTIITMLLPYLSSGFVPTNTMPNALRWISEYQPMTPIIETLRSLFLFSTPGDQFWIALAWLAGLFIAGYAISILMFNRRTSK